MTIAWYRERKAGDIPDRWKDVCDSLEAKEKINGKWVKCNFGAYLNDSQIASFRVDRYDNDKNNPRVEITVWSLE